MAYENPLKRKCRYCQSHKYAAEFDDHLEENGFRPWCRDCVDSAPTYSRSEEQAFLDNFDNRISRRFRDIWRVASASMKCASDRNPGSIVLEGDLAIAMGLSAAEDRLLLEEKTGEAHHIDHIKPICEGGLHVMDNLRAITARANHIKGPAWYDEDHLTDEDIERLDQEALSFNPERNAA